MSKVDKVYHNLLEAIIEDGYDYETDNRKGISCKQLSSYNLEIPLDNFPLLTTKKMFTKGIVGELIWFLRGDSNIKYLVDNNINIWNKDAYNWYVKKHKNIPTSYEKWMAALKNSHTGKSLGNVGKNYGVQWRDWSKLGIDDFNLRSSGYDRFSLDQIENLINNLRKENPITRRHIVTAWNPAELNDTALPPCHWAWEVLVEPNEDLKNGQSFSGGILDFSKNPSFTKTWEASKYDFTLKWHQRSVDTFLGLPFNIASYALLGYIIEELTGHKFKGLIGDLSNVHIYSPHIDAVNEQLQNNTEKYNGASLIISDRLKKVFKDFREGEIKIQEVFKSMEISDFSFENYQSYNAIKASMFEAN